MGRYQKLTILVFFTFLLLSPLQIVSAERGPAASLREAARYGKEGQLDFAFLELRDLLREHPEGPHVLEVEFAIGEYYFLQRNLLEAKRAFLDCLSKIQFDSIPRLLCQIYLLKCEEKGTSSEMSHRLLAQLKQELSSKKFFKAFDEKQTRSWESALGTLYTLNEFVNRLEILQNGQTFYTVTLP